MTKQNLALWSERKHLGFENLEPRRMLSATVTTMSDVVDDTDGVVSLREAIADANTNPGAEIINFDETLAGGTITLSGSELEITDSLTIDGSSLSESLTIDANNQSRVILFSGTSGDLSLADLRITGGNSGISSGGGIRFVSSGSLTLSNSTVSENRTTGPQAAGGGIVSIFNSGDITLVDTIVSNNISGFAGGGIDSANNGNVTMINSSITGNDANNSAGGGIAGGGGRISLTNSSISGNMSFLSGGIYTKGGDVDLLHSDVTGNTTTHQGGGISTASGNVTLTTSFVTGNSTGSDGGGIRTISGDVRLKNSSVSENTSGNHGGGIHTDTGSVTVMKSNVFANTSTNVGGGIGSTSGEVSLIASNISGNDTTGNGGYGGGIYARDGDVTLSSSTVNGNTTVGEFAVGGGIAAVFGMVSLTNTTVSYNSSASDGGGIWTSSSPVTISHSTISKNTADSDGGGVWVRNTIDNPPLTMENSIVAGNTAGEAVPDILPDIQGTLTINYSIIGIAVGLQTITGNLGNLIGTAASPINPELAPLDNNGGPTQTHALMPSSPAINTGEPNIASAPEYDQRGFSFSRIIDGQIDMGAVEAGAESADFDTDGDIDGADFLIWQRNFGDTTAVHADGDANVNGVVDSDDLQTWIETYGGTQIAELADTKSEDVIRHEENTAIRSFAFSVDRVEDKARAQFEVALKEEQITSLIDANSHDFQFKPTQRHEDDDLSASVQDDKERKSDIHTWIVDEVIESIFD